MSLNRSSRSRVFVPLLILPSLAWTLGCGMTAERGAGGSNGAGSGSAESGHVNRFEDGGSPAREEWVTRTAPAGTTLSARLDTTLDSSEANPGDRVQATLTSGVVDASGHVVLPSGTQLMGQVTEVVSAKRVKKKSSLAFRFDRAVLPDSTEVPMSASQGFDGKGWTGKQGGIIAGSAAGGALLGQLIGKDTDSTVAGAVVGGGIATGIIMSNKGEDIVLSAGSSMSLTLDGDVDVRRPANS